MSAVDFIIIGAGAGGVMAKELSAAGFRIVVLEQGPWLREGDFQHDEVSVMYRSALTNDFKKQPNLFRKTNREPAKRQPGSRVRPDGGRRIGPFHDELLAFSPGRFSRAIASRPGVRRGSSGLADPLRRPGTVLHQGGMGLGHLRFGW